MSEMINSTIGANEATANFSELLERVVGGEAITITRHGSPIARLLPVKPESTVESRQRAIAEMQQIEARNRLDGLRIRDLIAEGRR